MQRKLALLLLITISLHLNATAEENTPEPFLGRWALTIPGGGPGWLSVTQQDGYLDATILWGGGSVVPLTSVYIHDDTLYLTRERRISRRDENDEVIRVHRFTETIEAKPDGEKALTLTQTRPNTNGLGINTNTFTGVSIPPLPPTPDTNKIKYGDPIELFNGKNLDGWQLLNPQQKNGWYAEDGILVNTAEHKPGEKHVGFGNLRTTTLFEDFSLSTDVFVGENGNSGVYLRGIYEIQVSDSYGKELDSHNMGAIYSRITPTQAAEKKPGKWQELEMTLYKRHVTVRLNGKMIVDNQPLLGCTGGAITSNEFKPGPIYLQGDHSSAKYRNIVLRPILN